MSTRDEAGVGAGSGPGRLVLVATPIGNLGDLSPRAVETLAGADVVCCEDTRRTRELLTHAGIRARRLVSLHAHNERSRVEEVLSWLQEGREVALVSDAGTPSVSDPGQQVVAAVIGAGFEVSVVPGPSAAVASLVVSGLSTERYCFEGFLPRQGAKRRARLEVLCDEERTVLLHESPSRLAALLDDLAASLGGQRKVAVVRELTKLHEEIWRGTLAEASAQFSTRPVRGEVVLVLEGATDRVSAATPAEISALLEVRLESGESLKDASAAVARELGVSRRLAYELALGVRRNATAAHDVGP